MEKFPVISDFEFDTLWVYLKEETIGEDSCEDYMRKKMYGALWMREALL